MEILKPIGRWCMSGVGFTLAFIAALILGIFILTLLLSVSEKIRMFTIGGTVFIFLSLIYFMIEDHTLLEEQWVLLPLIAALFAWSMYISYVLEEAYFSFFAIIIEGIRVWIYGLTIFGLACTIFMIPFIFIVSASDRSRY